MQNFNLKNLQAFFKANRRFIRRIGYILLSFAFVVGLSWIENLSLLTQPVNAQVISPGSFGSRVTTDFVGTYRANTQYLSGDVNNDGYADVIEIWQNGSAWSAVGYINNRLGSFDSRVTTDFVGTYRANTQYLSGDVNNDGYADVIEIWQNGSAWSAVGYINNRLGSFDSRVTTDFVGTYRANTQYLSGDVNNDGYADVIEIWQNGSAWSAVGYINNRLGSFDSRVTTDFVGTYRANTQYLSGDVNNDGYADVIEIWQNGSAWSAVGYINNRLGSFDSRVTTDFVGTYRANTQYLSGDVNNDGYADVIEIWQNGSAWSAVSWINDGLGSFDSRVTTDFVGTYRANTRHLAGDVNNDGYADVIEIWQNGSAWSAVSWINIASDSSVLIDPGVILNPVRD